MEEAGSCFGCRGMTVRVTGGAVEVSGGVGHFVWREKGGF